jgi:hypothetical protein
MHSCHVGIEILCTAPSWSSSDIVRVTREETGNIMAQEVGLLWMFCAKTALCNPE